MTASKNDWSRFSLRIYVKATLEGMYEAWATRKAMEYWFLRVCEYKSAEGTPRKTRSLSKKVIPINSCGRASVKTRLKSVKSSRQMAAIFLN